MIQALEQIRVFTPLGIRFWDAVADAQIRDALNVTAWPELYPRQSRTASRTASDVYAFGRLPGLRAVENRLLEPDASPAPSHRFVVQVEDLRRRFLAVAVTVDLPLDYPGVYLVGTEVSPLEPPSGGFVLLSAPTRQDVAWLAMVRGDLVDAATGEPAAHAMLQLRAPGEPTWYGLADERGRFALFFPYPTLVEGLGGSPTNGNSAPLEERTWSVAFEVYYEPGAQQPLPGTAVPEYLSLLSQRQGGIWEVAPQDGGLESSDLVGELHYGSQWILATQGLSHLLISPAESSP